MIEEEFDIDAFDGKKIFCVHNRAKEQKSDRVVVIVHGLTCTPKDYMHQVARDLFCWTRI